jgi:hypothetical protein
LIVDANIRDGLDRYIERTADHFGPTELEADTGAVVGREDARTTLRDTPALMLEIWPTAPPGNRCNVQGRLFYSTERIFNVYTRDDDNVLRLDDEEGLMRMVTELQEELAKRGVADDQVMIEFILPREMLSEAVEQWPNDADEPMGTYAPVVVRSRERFLEPKGTPRVKALPSTLWRFAKKDWKDIRGHLRAGACIAFEFVPDVLAQPREHDLNYLLNVGTAFALWPRRAQGLPDLAFAEGQSVEELPNIIRNMRYKLWSQEKEADPRYHLTLLWDDPSRRLPGPDSDDEFLQAPL